MKDKKILILIVYAAVVLGVLLFLSRPVVKHKEQISLAQEAGQETEIAKLREEVKQTKELIHSFVQMNLSLKNNLNAKERRLIEKKEKLENLSYRLNELVLENEMLNKKLTSAREALTHLEELTQPIRRRLEGLESTFEGISASLATLGFSPGKEKELRRQLVFLRRELNAIDRQIPTLIKENKNYRKQAETLRNLLGRKDSQIQNLKEKLKQGLATAKELQGVIIEKSRLERKLNESRERNKLLEGKLGEKDERIENLENRLKEELAEKEEELNRLLEAKANLEREISQLREKNVNMKKQLEINQEFEEQLKLTRAELDKLNSQYADLKVQYQSVKDTIAKNEAELAKRAERILSLQDRLIVAERNIQQLQNDSLQQKEESASLRKQYVTRQLESERLKRQLNLYKQKLADLQSQIMQAAETNSILQERLREISNIFRTKETSSTPEVSTKKVDVELIPKVTEEVEDEK